MIAVAIFSSDPDLRRSLEQLMRGEPGVAIVGVADDPSGVPQLIEQNRADALLADSPPHRQLSDWCIRYDRTAFVVLVQGADLEVEALHAGAQAILPRSAGRGEIVVAIQAVTGGLAVLPHDLVATLLNGGAPADPMPGHDEAGGARLTPRELEVLAAMADGASNKAIARRLEISFHTAKFHVAAILEKLNADSRTEAVTRAAQLGLVML
jgi:DNA-binding NarL/FixJ family response regulator